MKNLITIILLGLTVFYNTGGADSTVVVSKKHKRVLKSASSIQYPASSIQYPVSSIQYLVSKVDTFVDNDKDGINDLRKKDEKNALFRFLNEKASSYVKEKNTKTEEPSTAPRLVPKAFGDSGTDQKVNVKSRSGGTEQKKLPAKKTVKVKKATRK